MLASGHVNKKRPFTISFTKKANKKLHNQSERALSSTFLHTFKYENFSHVQISDKTEQRANKWYTSEN